jgi:hypothetical protein
MKDSEGEVVLRQLGFREREGIEENRKRRQHMVMMSSSCHKVRDHREERLRKKNTPCCLSWADTEMIVKSTMCPKDRPDYVRIKKEGG